ncbi:hypothetical protein QTP88_019679 [Uroleucon formosanum]
MERNDIIAMRVKFLRKMCHLRQSNDTRPIVYLDETWVNQNHSRGQIWQNAQNTEGLKIPTGSTDTTDQPEPIVDDFDLDLGDLESGPKRPKLKQFPLTQFGSQKRGFNSSYYVNNNWLEYSINKDAIFCYACRIFGNNHTEPTFTSVGFKNWKKLCGSRGLKNGKQSKLDAHASTKTHLTCMAKWSGHNITVQKTGTVHTQLTTQHQLEIAANREYMNSLIDITLYLATQGLAFRGHDENKTSLNQGNFKEACVLFSKHMPKFSEIFSKDTNYTSHHIQDEIIDICANSVKDSIIEEVGPGIFSIMCDEARCYKDEQMSLCIRYVKDFDIKERFLGFIDCSEKQDAQALSDHILNYLQTCKLSEKAQIISQSYDGANVMSGKFNGVQSKIKTKFPHATFTHCMAHRINLVVVDMCKIVKETSSFFNTIECIYVHFSHPSKNRQLTDLQKSLGLKIKTFGRISNTRWNCRYKNCEALKQCFRSILIVLKTEIENEADRDVNEAIGILSTITKGQFVVVLFIMSHVLCTINILSNMFQDKNATLGKSAKLINNVIKSIEDSRTSESFSSIWTSIQTFAKEHGISIDIPSQPKRKRQQPSHLVQFLVSTTTGATSEAVDVETILAEDYFRINIYFKVLDSIIVNLKKRFSNENLSLAVGVDEFIKLNYDGSTQFIDHYKDLPGLNICQQSLRSEMMVAKNYLVEPEIGDIGDIKKNISPQVFPNFCKMFQLALTLPISSATCERSFSAMRKIKTWLRTSIQQKKFNELSILYIEKDKTKLLNNDTILNIFEKKCNRISAYGATHLDYHTQMNATIFKKWFIDMLNNLEEPCVIVMDNASYHSVLSVNYPKSNAIKSSVQQWLRENGGFFSIRNTE